MNSFARTGTLWGDLHDAIVKLIFLVTFRQGFTGPLMNILEVQITLLTETHI